MKTLKAYRLEDDSIKKIERLTQMRNADAKIKRQSAVTNTDIIEEAILFYYDYYIGNDGGDEVINRLYERELRRVVIDGLAPIRSAVNYINHQQQVITMLLNVIYLQNNRWADSDQIRSDIKEALHVNEYVKEYLDNMKRKNNEEEE